MIEYCFGHLLGRTMWMPPIGNILYVLSSTVLDCSVNCQHQERGPLVPVSS